MRFKVDEIASVIEEEIRKYRTDVDLSEVGTVIEVGDGIARIYGLRNAMAGELLEFAERRSWARSSTSKKTRSARSSSATTWRSRKATRSSATGRLLEVPVGEALIGRVVNPLGQPLDGGPPIVTTERRKMDIIAPGIAERQPVNEPLQTGIKAIDA